MSHKDQHSHNCSCATCIRDKKRIIEDEKTCVLCLVSHGDNTCDAKEDIISTLLKYECIYKDFDDILADVGRLCSNFKPLPVKSS
jgi:hypothetical protein